MRENRNDWLRADDASLREQCREERYRAGGPGGQRRNKVETAVRLHHRPSGISSQAEESRLFAENRKRALRRLRERIAFNCREPVDISAPALPPEFLQHRTSEGSLIINRRNPAYPLVLATMLDALAATGGSYARAGQLLMITTSQVIRVLRADREAWRAAEAVRATR